MFTPMEGSKYMLRTRGENTIPKKNLIHEVSIMSLLRETSLKIGDRVLGQEAGLFRPKRF